MYLVLAWLLVVPVQHALARSATFKLKWAKTPFRWKGGARHWPPSGTVLQIKSHLPDPTPCRGTLVQEDGQEETARRAIRPTRTPPLPLLPASRRSSISSNDPAICESKAFFWKHFPAPQKLCSLLHLRCGNSVLALCLSFSLACSDISLINFDLLWSCSRKSCWNMEQILTADLHD